MRTLTLLLYVVAVILLVLGAFGVHPRAHLGFIGLAVWCFAAGILEHLD